MNRTLVMPEESAILQANALAERVLSPEEFRAAADKPLTADERAQYEELIAWFSRRYPTALERLAYIRRSMAQIAHAPSRPTALLTQAYVAPGGHRVAEEDPSGVRVCLMNVLRWTATDVSTRWQLLGETIRRVRADGAGPTVLLTPGGYFGHDSVNGQGRRTLKAGLHDREEVLRLLREELSLPADLLLVLGVDHVDRQTLLFIEKGRPPAEVVRHQSLATERRYPFAGLTLFGVICGEFSPREGYGPMFPGPPDSARFAASRDIQGQGIDVVLNTAHIEVKCRQHDGAAHNRFPFERFFLDVSSAGAACFLAHHHPDAHWPQGPDGAPGPPKNHSYSNWGIFAGSGSDADWLSSQTPVRRITAPSR